MNKGKEFESSKLLVVNTDTHTQRFFFPLPKAIHFNSTNDLLSFHLQRLTFKNYYMILSKWHYTELNYRLNF